MKILITGAAGFIGFHLTKKLLELNFQVFGIDNINEYYNPKLKYMRLENLGIIIDQSKKTYRSSKYKKFNFLKIDLNDKKSLNNLFKKEKFEIVCNLAAQPGIRYSLINPASYIENNILGFFNIIDCCRIFGIKHLIYASSSSVYGENKIIPFNETHKVDSPLSLYAATKKSNELIAHTYSHLYNFKTTGLRFFTVYGPWGRPDMAYYIFTESISKYQTIDVYNNGNMARDFTYIDDIIQGITKIIKKTNGNRDNYKIYNIGNNKTEKLITLINSIENELKLKGKLIFKEKQLGDVLETYSNIEEIKNDYGYKPRTDLKNGIKEFVKWYKIYNDKI